MICIDARWLHAPGIGTYLKNLLPYLAQYPMRWSALVHPEQQDELAALGAIEPILVSSAPLTVKEQMELFRKIPRVDLFWSVHINVPWLPIRAKARLVTIHDILHLTPEGTLRGVDKLCAQLMTHAALLRADQIITEYGIASLRGLSVHARAEALISIAAPRFRDELTFAWARTAARLAA